MNYYFSTQNFSKKTVRTGYAQNSLLLGLFVCCLLLLLLLLFVVVVFAAHTALDPWLWPLMDWILENLHSGNFCRWSHPIYIQVSIIIADAGSWHSYKLSPTGVNNCRYPYFGLCSCPTIPSECQDIMSAIICMEIQRSIVHHNGDPCKGHVQTIALL